jgi:hypothetical protein
MQDPINEPGYPRLRNGHRYLGNHLSFPKVPLRDPPLHYQRYLIVLPCLLFASTTQRAGHRHAGRRRSIELP